MLQDWQGIFTNIVFKQIINIWPVRNGTPVSKLQSVDWLASNNLRRIALKVRATSVKIIY